MPFECRDPLVFDASCPFRSEEPGGRETHEGTGHGNGEQDARVQQGCIARVPRHSIVQSEIAGVVRHTLERSGLPLAHGAFIGQQVFERDAAVRADHAVLEPALLDLLDDERP